MIREVSFDEISDGKKYSLNDMVKADCNDCKGCFKCCCNMGNSIVLDPLDIVRMKVATGLTFQEMIEKYIELHVVDGLILPSIMMNKDTNTCNFLDSNGRCSIHSMRPGICRLFPLGRIYEDGSFSYFLQTKECVNKARTKVKVKKWIDTPDCEKYDAYINSWHYFLKDVGKYIEKCDEKIAKQVATVLLNYFYVNDFTLEYFYEEYEGVMNRIKSML